MRCVPIVGHRLTWSSAPAVALPLTQPPPLFFVRHFFPVALQMFKFAVVTLLACALVASAARVPVEGETPYPLKAGWRVTEDLLEDKSEGKFFYFDFFVARDFFWLF